jgi:hypothetical protein
MIGPNVRSRRDRSIALGAGILVASVSSVTGSALAVTPAVLLAATISLALVAAVVTLPALQASHTAPAAALAED